MLTWVSLCFHFSLSLNTATLLLSVIAYNYYPLSIAVYKKCHYQNHSHVLVIPYEWMEIGAGLKKMQNKQFMDSAASFLLIYWWYPSHLLLTSITKTFTKKCIHCISGYFSGQESKILFYFCPSKNPLVPEKRTSVNVEPWYMYICCYFWKRMYFNLNSG